MLDSGVGPALVSASVHEDIFEISAYEFWTSGTAADRQPGRQAGEKALCISLTVVVSVADGRPIGSLRSVF